MKWFITGDPGVGKTTLIESLFKELTNKGIKADGFITKEIREGKIRTGFIIIDLKNKEEALLAKKTTELRGPRIGSYSVFIENIENFALKCLERAYKESELVICDEIGAMEMLSKAFEKRIQEIIISDKSLLASLHRRFLHLADLAKFKKLIFLNRENREKIKEELLREIFSSFSKS